MEARKCLYCGNPIPAEKRADSKFCGNSCKANHWEENKGKHKPADIKPVAEKVQVKPQVEKPLEGLRGVIENKSKTDDTVVNLSSVQAKAENISIIPLIKKETQEYKDALAKKEKAEADIKRIENLLLLCRNNLGDWQNEKEKHPILKSVKKYRAWHTDVMDLEDSFLDDTIESLSRSEKAAEIQEKIDSLTENKNKLEKMLPTAKKIFDAAQQKLITVPRYEKPSLKELAYSMGLFQKKTQEEVVQIENKETQTEPKEIIEQTEVNPIELKQNESPATIQTNGKLISSRELREMDYKSLNFKGRWQELFGQPAVIFHLAVHGKPGEGKSTFCIQFADYLAKNFGQVVYISGEEGFSKTMRDKIINNKIDNPYLFFADISSFEQIKNEIENKFHFIFIDSLDTLRIDALRLRELKELYPQSAFITISQSTKDGKMRGSQEIVHDTDIAVKVEDGIAMTTKNRYNPRGAEFRVFPAPEKSVNKIIDEPRNVI